jgi:hypothetical protein
VPLSTVSAVTLASCGGLDELRQRLGGDAAVAGDRRGVVQAQVLHRHGRACERGQRELAADDTAADLDDHRIQTAVVDLSDLAEPLAVRIHDLCSNPVLNLFGFNAHGGSLRLASALPSAQ